MIIALPLGSGGSGTTFSFEKIVAKLFLRSDLLLVIIPPFWPS